jgi:hypothetical protein
VHRAKQRSGYVFVRKRGERLWQESYFDRLVRRDESLPDVIRYIIANPVRAGLVTRAVDYPHWGSSTHSREELLEFLSIQSRV